MLSGVFSVAILGLVPLLTGAVDVNCTGSFPPSVHVRAYNGLCYAYVTLQKLDYSEAKDQCQKFNGILAQVKTESLSEALANGLYSQGQSGEFWIGLNALRLENVYEWEDGSEMSYSGFNSSDNTSGQARGRCVTMRFDGLWSYHECKSSYTLLDGIKNFSLDTREHSICQFDGN